MDSCHIIIIQYDFQGQSEGNPSNGQRNNWYTWLFALCGQSVQRCGYIKVSGQGQLVKAMKLAVLEDWRQEGGPGHKDWAQGHLLQGEAQ